MALVSRCPVISCYKAIKNTIFFSTSIAYKSPIQSEDSSEDYLLLENFETSLVTQMFCYVLETLNYLWSFKIAEDKNYT